MPNYATILLSLFAFVPLIMVLYKRSKRKKLLNEGVQVTGIVTTLSNHRGTKGNKYAKITIDYPVDGKGTITGIHFFMGHQHPIFYKGNKLDLYYDKQNPEKFILRDGPKYVGLLILTLLLALGVLFCMIAVFDMLGKG